MNYRAYGLTLACNVPISSLVPISDVVDGIDLSVEIGAPPSWVLQALDLPVYSSRGRDSHGTDPKFVFSDLGGQFFRLNYTDGTQFVVDKPASRVWGQAGPGLSCDDVFVYLLGPVAGFILRQRGRVALHASAVNLGGSAIALMGPAGAGKSTAAAALALRGWPVCCEDVCALYEHDETTYVLPGYPRVCLWPDSVRMLFLREDALPLIVEGWNKRFLALDGVHGVFAESAAPLRAIYLLAQRLEQTCEPRIQALSRQDATLRLVQNTYMNWLLNQNQRAAEFDALVKLVSNVPCFEVRSSGDPAELERTAITVESHTLSLIASIL